MNRHLLFGVALAFLGLAATPLISQTQTTTSSSSSGYVQTSKIVGTKVKTQNGEEVGVVKDVVLDRSNGCMAYTVLSTGGTGSRVTGQSKMVAVPWSVYTVSPDSTYLTTTVERDRLYNGPVFEYSRIGDPSFTSTVYSTFGVSAAGVGYSNATSTTTGVNAQTQTSTNANTANTATNATSPAPSAAGPTNNPSPAMSTAPSATAAPSASASASASTKSTHGAKGGMSPASSPRHHGDESMKGTGTTDESASESTGSSSGTKASKSSKKGSSAEKSTSEESSGEATEGSSSTKKSSHKKGGSSEGTTAEPTPQE